MMSNMKEASSGSFSALCSSIPLLVGANLALAPPPAVVLRDERTMLEGPAERAARLAPVPLVPAEAVLAGADKVAAEVAADTEERPAPAVVREVGLRGAAEVPRLMGDEGDPVEGAAVSAPVAMDTERAGETAAGLGRSAHSAAKAAAALSFQDARGVYVTAPLSFRMMTVLSRRTSLIDPFVVVVSLVSYFTCLHDVTEQISQKSN